VDAGPLQVRSPRAGRREGLDRFEVARFLRLVEDETDLVDPGVEERLHLGAALVRRADDGHGIDHFVRPLRGLLEQTWLWVNFSLSANEMIGALAMPLGLERVPESPHP
jgi:hypothetical protein